MAGTGRAAAAPIREAGPGEADAVAGLVAAAFADLPLHHWLVPDPGRRATVFRRWFRLHVDHALAHGSVETADGLSAAALWLPGRAPAPDLSDALLRACCGPWWPRFRTFRQVLERPRAPSGGHTRLVLLAVHPAQQGRGLGSALLEHRPAASAGPVLLEAPTPAARRFYLSHGFTGDGPPAVVPGSGTRLFPLVSAPAGPH